MDTYIYERELREKGINLIAGVDEVGRGPLVGPVVTACVILPEKFDLEGLTDSKKLSEKKREELYKKIEEQALGIGIGIVDNEEIDNINISTNTISFDNNEKCYIGPKYKNNFMEVFNNGNFTNNLDSINNAK